MDIGTQINELREQKNISLEALSLGICTDESLRNMELGKETVNKLLMEILFQRLGKSTDKLELIVSEAVYEEELLLERYEELLECGDKEQAARTLDITMPGWQVKRLEEYWLSNIEMENLLAYAKTQLAIGTKEELETAESLLLACKRFMDGRVTDGEEHAKIFAKCAHLLGELCIKQGDFSKAEYFAERGLNGLREYGISYFMEPLLKILVQYVPEKSTEKPAYQCYLDALLHLKKFAGAEQHFTDSLFKNCSQQTYYLDYELFREERIAQGYSQEQMIEGVYKNPESLSRAERGKVTMRDSKLIRLFRRLGIDKTRYNGFVVTDDYAVLGLKQQVDIFLSRSCYKEAEEVLEELKKRLNLKVAENSRWIQGYEITMGTWKEDISKEELLKQALNLLQETYQLRTKGAYRVPMDREVDLINQMGILLRQTGREEEAVELFRCVIAAMKRSKVQLKKRYRSYSLLRTNLAKWEQSTELAKENITFALDCGKLRCLPMNYMTVTCALLDVPVNKERCRNMLKDVYYLLELSCNDTNKNVTIQYYKSVFGEEMI